MAAKNPHGPQNANVSQQTRPASCDGHATPRSIITSPVSDEEGTQGLTRPSENRPVLRGSPLPASTVWGRVADIQMERGKQNRL